MRYRVLALAPCAMLACGATPSALLPAPPARTTRYYQPLEMTRDVQRIDRAVILGTDDRNGSTVLVLPGAPRTVIVDAMFPSQRGTGSPSGGLIAVTLTAGLETPASAPVPGGPTSPTPATRPSNATSAATAAATAPATAGATSAAGSPSTGAPIASTTVGGDAPGGAAWQAGLWRARFVAGTALGKDPGDIAITAAPAVPAGDASALIAAGILAALTGEPLDPKATLIGAIHPDGTIGPVAGLPEQLAAAIAHGKTRIGYPSGMRIARSEATGRDVDLVQLARARRADAIELATVYDAYQLMTRAQLPAPVPLGEADMALDAEMLEGLRTRYLEWQKRLAGEWAALLRLEQSGRLPAVVTRLVRLAHQHSGQAESLYRAGTVAAALRRLRSAWVHAASANDTYRVLAKLHAGDLPGAAATLIALESADTSASAIVARLGELRPATLAGQLAMMAALHASLRGASYRGFAAGALRTANELLAGLDGTPPGALGAPATADAVASVVAPAAMMVRSAIAELTIAEHELALAPDRGVRHAPSPAGARRLTGAFRDASLATVRHLDALLVDPVARRAMPADAARRHVAAELPVYLIADQLARLAPGEHLQALGASWSAEAPAASLVSLAGYQVAYQGAALVAARHGFTFHLDEAGRIDRVEPADAFRHLLAAARRNARAAARAARIATGEVPVQSRLAYQLAAVDDAADVSDQLDALAELWTAFAFAQTAVMLARN
jgi:hypothetical protein